MQQANIINMITYKDEPQQKHRLTLTLTLTLERSIKITGGLKPVLRDPNLALGFCHGSCSVRVKVF